jgi:hypothetical protein
MKINKSKQNNIHFVQAFQLLYPWAVRRLDKWGSVNHFIKFVLFLANKLELVHFRDVTQTHKRNKLLIIGRKKHNFE